MNVDVGFEGYHRTAKDESSAKQNPTKLAILTELLNNLFLNCCKPLFHFKDSERVNSDNLLIFLLVSLRKGFLKVLFLPLPLMSYSFIFNFYVNVCLGVLRVNDFLKVSTKEPLSFTRTSKLFSIFCLHLIVTLFISKSFFNISIIFQFIFVVPCPLII